MIEFQKFMSDVLMCEPEELPEVSTPLRNIDGWDSLKHVMLVVSLEQKLNAKLTADEIQGMVNLSDVARVLERKGVNA